MSKLTRQIRINAPVEKVWEVLADFGGVSKWAPTVTESYSTTEANGGIGAGRHCEVIGFGGIEEEIVGWNESRSLSVSLENAGPIKSAVITFSVSPSGDETVVTLTTESQLKFGPLGAVIDKLFFPRLLGKQMAQTLAGLNHHAETGEVVGTETEVPVAAVAAA